jgi:hypothetical protein
MPTVKKRIFIIAGVALVGICLWFGARESAAGHNVRQRRNASDPSRPMDSSDFHNTPDSMKTKSSIRDMNGPRATHGPERLKEFFLPAVDIKGLTLHEALVKLMGVYEEACMKAGEVPIRLTFDVPPAATKRLHLKLGARDFNSSIRLLGTYAGMKVNRDKTEYHFEPITDERKQVKKNIPVVYDFTGQLSDQAGLGVSTDSAIAEDQGMPTEQADTVILPISEILMASGLELDPSTRVSLASSGYLELETSSAADAAVISSLAESLGVSHQHRFTTKVLHIPGDLDWSPPDAPQMTESEVQLFVRRMAQKKGVDLMTLPSTAGKNNQSADIEITRELLSPTNEEGTEFEKHDIGVVMRVKSGALGFGQEVDFRFTNTTGELDSSGKKAIIQKQTDISDSGYVGDQGTRFSMQTLPDGSRVVVMLTATLIDNTGRPLRATE